MAERGSGALLGIVSPVPKDAWPVQNHVSLMCLAYEESPILLNVPVRHEASSGKKVDVGSECVDVFSNCVDDGLALNRFGCGSM